MFVTGTHAIGSWWGAARFRLAHHRRLPVPSPYFLASGTVELSL
ncbi:MAG: hypothetical protein R2719_00785 [Micropruina sp.]